MKLRHYTAFFDDGHDYGELEFTSLYRAGSSANMEDARSAFRRAYGNKRLREVTIYQIQRSASA